MRMLSRERRSGEVLVLALALLVSVAALSSVGFFSDRIENALTSQANDLLGGNLVLVSDHDWNPLILARAADDRLQQSHSMSFPSMVLAEQANALARIKVVDKNFPLKGKFRIAEKRFQSDRVVNGGPPAGEVWVHEGLLSSLKITVGSMVQVGMTSLKVSAIITHEPGQIGGMISIAPRLLMNQFDLLATQLVQPESRINYQLTVAGEASVVSGFSDFVEAREERGLRMMDIRNARPEIRDALDKASRFLGLAALSSVLLAGVAIALAARRYVSRHLNQCAIMKCLGVTAGRVVALHFYQLLVLGGTASLLGAGLGYLFQFALVALLQELVGIDVPAPSLMPLWVGVLAGVVILIGFALPVIWQVGAVPAMRVLRRDMGGATSSGAIGYLIAMLTISGLMVWQAGSFKLGVYVIVGTLCLVVLLAGLGWLLLRWLRWQIKTGLRGGWRFGLANISRRISLSITQLVAFGLGLMALLLLTVIQQDLLREWQGSVPKDAPNRFLINIQKGQLDELNAFFKGIGQNDLQLSPMIRGRLNAINGQAISPENFESERAKRLAEREFNLSYMDDMPGHNQSVAGEWWLPGSSDIAQLSVEEGVAKTLGISLGDELSYEVAGESFSGKVRHLRSVSWDSFQVNFFVIGRPQLLEGFPASYITSFHLPLDQGEQLDELVKRFPNITVIDVASIMQQVRTIISQVSNAVQYVFLFTLFAGVVVLYAALQLTHDERRQEYALIRTLGATRKQVWQGVLAEFMALGLLAGLVAGIAASVIAALLASQVLGLSGYLDVKVLVVGVLLGIALVGGAGLLGSRAVVNQPPVVLLRRG